MEAPLVLSGVRAPASLKHTGKTICYSTERRVLSGVRAPVSLEATISGTSITGSRASIIRGTHSTCHRKSIILRMLETNSFLVSQGSSLTRPAGAPRD